MGRSGGVIFVGGAGELFTTSENFGGYREMFTRTRERRGKHGLFNREIQEDAHTYSVILYFYEAGKARIGNFFLAGSLKVS